jgi:hypothetical protein
MKNIFVVLVGVLLIHSAVLADTRCRTDSFGNSVCRDDDGNTVKGRKDSFGNETWRDDKGNTVRGRTDSFGNKIYRDDSGNTVSRVLKFAAPQPA